MAVAPSDSRAYPGRMLARLALALLIACLAGPALASPACIDMAPPTATASPHHGMPTEHAPVQSMSHDCIGCIAPTHGLPGPVIRVRPARALSIAYHAAPLLLGSVLHPEIPPPRSSV